MMFLRETSEQINIYSKKPFEKSQFALIILYNFSVPNQCMYRENSLIFNPSDFYRWFIRNFDLNQPETFELFVRSNTESIV